MSFWAKIGIKKGWWGRAKKVVREKVWPLVKKILWEWAKKKAVEKIEDKKDDTIS